VKTASRYCTVAPRPTGARRAVPALILREMATTYGRSPGGWLWAVVEPVAAIALLSLAFSLAFSAPSLGVSFPLFYATGYLPYMLFHDVSSRTAQAIRFNRPLMNFGAVSWLDVLAARYLLNLLTHVAVGVLVLGALILLTETRASPDLPRIANAVVIAALIAAGTGALNAYLFLAFPAWERVWTILTRPLFIVSGIFFLYEDMPAEVRDILWFNPLFHVTGQMRAGFFPTYGAEYASAPYAAGLGVLLLVLGFLLMARHADGLIHK
jgi:capsular polysaccharide transport system permease protein